jgi:hypothetical protein
MWDHMWDEGCSAGVEVGGGWPGMERKRYGGASAAMTQSYVLSYSRTIRP